MSPGMTPWRPQVSAAALCGTLALAACAGEEPALPASEAPAPVTLAPASLRRLNRTEYNNTVRDLLGPFGVSSRPADAFPPDLKARGCDNNAALLMVPAGTAEAFLVAAEGLAQAALQNRIRCTDPLFGS